MSVVPVPSSVVSGCEAMSLTARASAFSIVFGVTWPVPATSAKPVDRARARDLAADMPAHAVRDDEQGELGEQGVLVHLAATPGVSRGRPR